MEIKLSKAGEYQYIDKSLRWQLSGGGYYETTLAGQKLKAIQYEDGRIRLDYMGYESFGFDSLEQARKSGQEFALQVLELVKQRILDFPPVEPRPVLNLVINDDVEP